VIAGVEPVGVKQIAEVAGPVAVGSAHDALGLGSRLRAGLGTHPLRHHALHAGFKWGDHQDPEGVRELAEQHAHAPPQKHHIVGERRIVGDRSQDHVVAPPLADETFE
jgi:hypothetical protein